MLTDAGGTFLTRHCVAVAWSPHELIDAVTCCVLCSRVSKLGNTGHKGSSHSRTAQKDAFTESREQSQIEAALEKTLDPIAGNPATENPWQESSIYLWMIFFGRNGNEREHRVLTRQRKCFQFGSEARNDVAITGQRIRWTQDSQNGPHIEVSQNKAIDELEDIPVDRNTKEDLHCTPSMNTM